MASAAMVLLLAISSPAGGQSSTLSALEDEVRAQPSDPAVLIALGVARLERGQRRAAARAFFAAAVRARTPHEAAIAYHDLGVVALEEGDFESARAAFLDALAFSPGDEKSRFNLEWASVALRQSALAPETQPDVLPPLPQQRPPPPDPAPPDVGAEQSLEAVVEPPPLSEAESRRRLERVEDDPGRALRSAAAAGRSAARTEAPVW